MLRIPLLFGLCLLRTSRGFSSGSGGAYRGGMEPTITSESNPKVKLLKSLRLTKYRQREQLVLLEGPRSILDCLSNNHNDDEVVMMEPVHLLATSRAFSSPLGEKLYRRVSSLPCLDIVSESVLASISETVHSQGVVAAFRMPPPLTSLPSNASLLVICDGVSDPGNLGTILRTSFGLGVDAVLLTEGCCDVYSSKVLRASMGTALSPLLPILKLPRKDIPALLSEKGFQVLIADAGGVNYERLDYRVKTALVLGAEAAGVSALLRDAPGSTLIQIPMQRGILYISKVL